MFQDDETEEIATDFYPDEKAHESEARENDAFSHEADHESLRLKLRLTLKNNIAEYLKIEP